jgi:hypothetical protein
MDFLQQQGIQVKVIPGMILHISFILLPSIDSQRERIWLSRNVEDEAISKSHVRNLELHRLKKLNAYSLTFIFHLILV